MYIALLIVLIALGGFLISRGIRQSKPGKTVGGALIIVATALFFGLLSFWGEALWFREVGYSARFWTVVTARITVAGVGALFGWLVVFLLTKPIPRSISTARVWPEIFGACIGLLWGLANWAEVLRYLNRVTTGVRDPILNNDTGFYLFALPFYDSTYSLAITLCIVSLAAVLVAYFVSLPVRTPGSPDYVLQPAEWRTSDLAPVSVVLGTLFLVLAFGRLLSIYHLMYSTLGVVTGPGWTDIHIRWPAYGIVGGACFLFGLGLLIPATRRWLQRIFGRWRFPEAYAALGALIAPLAVIAALWFVSIVVLPGFSQWLHVQPNEITVEKPYIANSIRFTRLGFGLDQVEDRGFPASEALTAETLERNKALLSEVRLWDGRALDAVYKQFQEIRLYYEFADIDIDRYQVGGKYRQVMVSARDMNQGNLPRDSQTFVNKRFKYTHGNGITMAPVSDFTPEGLPNLLLKDIPPQAQFPELEVKTPDLYYAQLTTSHAVVNSREPEFHYPSGDTNVYTHYSGTGGVPLSSLWRKFLYGWKFDGTRFFLSSYTTADSRLMFRRNVRERVQTIAPFLTVDPDPYVVLVGGRLYWIVDAYTTSKYFPYSEPYNSLEEIEYSVGNETRLMHRRTAQLMEGANYVRNSVKAVVDAYNGQVDLYVFDSSDPIIQVWQRVFPGLLKNRDAMPPELAAHVRYPHDLLLVQSLVYAKYHMTDPAVFYNREDLWIRATEKYQEQIEPVEPYYIMWRPAEGGDPEFSLILPFTPKKRQVLIGWMAGLCDGENYGRLLSYKFPKERRVLGPQQVDTKIDQDSFLSGQLTLWNQMGSKVIRGNVLALPIDGTLIYVEPIYLQAETAAYPELRLVAVMHGDNLSYANTLEEALAGLIREEEGAPVEARPAGKPSSEFTVFELRRAFDAYLRLQSEKKFAEAAKELEKLEAEIERLKGLGDRK